MLILNAQSTKVVSGQITSKMSHLLFAFNVSQYGRENLGGGGHGEEVDHEEDKSWKGRFLGSKRSM